MLIPIDAFPLIAGNDAEMICTLACVCKCLNGLFKTDARKAAVKQFVKVELFGYFARMWLGHSSETELVRDGNYGNVQLQITKSRAVKRYTVVETFMNGRYSYVRMNESPSHSMLSVDVFVDAETNLRGHMRVSFLEFGRHPKLKFHVGYHRGAIAALVALGVVDGNVANI